MFQFETEAGPIASVISSLPIEFINKNYFGTQIDMLCTKPCFFKGERPPLMSAKKILVPLVTSAKSLKSVHYALSLAERLGAQVYILQQIAGSAADALSIWMDEALPDLINSARQAGLGVSHHITRRLFEEEIVELVRKEGIDVLVFGVDDGAGERFLLQIKPLISSQVIQVREKDHISYLKQEEGAK